MGKKTNPRRIPKTQEDVNRAYERGMDEGFSKALTLLLWVLVNRHGVEMDELQRFADEVSDVDDSVGKGYISIHDIERAMKEEYDLEIK